MSELLEEILRLVSEAGLSIGFIHGNGLGALLLTVIALAYILSPVSKRFKSEQLIKLLLKSRGPFK